MKPFRISHRQLQCLTISCAVLFFILTVVFGCLYGWALNSLCRDCGDTMIVDTGCIEKRLLTEDDAFAAQGYYDESGKECVYHDHLPNACAAYYNNIAECPSSQSRRLSSNEVFAYWQVKNGASQSQSSSIYFEHVNITLRIAEEYSGENVYSRPDWGSGWNTRDALCFTNVRFRVLWDEALEEEEWNASDECSEWQPTACESSGGNVSCECEDGRTTPRHRVTSGSWLSLFDHVYVQNPSELDIDHMVALSEAHRSGAYTWDNAQKRNYYNYVEDEGHLIAVTSRSNREKSDNDPSRWKPNKAYWCTYASDWIKIKHRWNLTVDKEEAIALNFMIATC